MKEIYKEVAKSLSLPKEVVRDIYYLYWSFIRETIRSTDIKNTKELSFNIPSLGKIYLSKYKIRRKNEIKHKENQTNE